MKTGIEILYNLAQKKKIPHALIIETNDMNIFDDLKKIIKVFVCNNENQACDLCNSCKKIEKNTHPDIKIISLEEDSNSIKINQIREIGEDAHIIPNESDYKIYVINQADHMTVQAQNAFIKILEEPPNYVKFMLICSSATNLLETVRSRCEIFRYYAQENDKKNEISDISEQIFRSIINKNKSNILEILSKIPNNRIFLKSLIKNILERYINLFRNNQENKNSITQTIDDLQYILNLVDRNINFNLLINYLLIIL